jgi:hypothetical protein
MATLRQIADKGAQLKAAFEILESYQQDKQTAQARVQAVNGLISSQQVIVDTLKTELQAMVNEGA